MCQKRKQNSSKVSSEQEKEIIAFDRQKLCHWIEKPHIKFSGAFSLVIEALKSNFKKIKYSHVNSYRIISFKKTILK